jgi:hypothetical protein
LITAEGTTATYDLPKRTFRTIAGKIYPWPIHPSPIRPDGAGFLCLRFSESKEGSDGTTAVFCSWEGATKDLKLPGNKDWNALHATWNGNEAVLEYTDGSCTLDTGNGSMIWKPRAQQAALYKDASVCARSPDNDCLIRCRVSKRAADGSPEEHRLEAVPLVAAPTTGSDLLTELRLSALPALFSQSPNGKWVAISCRLEQAPMIHVVSFSDRRGSAPPILFRSDSIQKAKVPTANSDSSKLPPEYVIAAKYLCDRIAANKPETRRNLDLAQLIADCDAAALDLSAIKTENPEMRFVASSGATSFRDFSASVNRMRKLPAPPGDAEIALEMFIIGLGGDVPDGFDRTREIAKASQARKDEARVAGAAFIKRSAAKLLLPKIAARFAGPKNESGQAVHVMVVNRWGPISDDGLILIHNATAPLHNCTILVALEDQNGEVAKNVHFVPKWTSGDSLDAVYKCGADFGDGEKVCPQTVENLRRVRVSLWADELTQEDITCTCSRGYRTRQVRQLCKDISLATRYQPFKAGLFGSNRGIVATMQGIAVLPSCRVTVEFFDAEKRQSISWDFARWSNGEDITFSSPQFLWDPKSYSVSIEFPDNDHEIMTLHGPRWGLPL